MVLEVAALAALLALDVTPAAAPLLVVLIAAELSSLMLLEAEETSDERADAALLEIDEATAVFVAAEPVSY